MKFKVNKFALAAGITMVLWHIAYTFYVYYFPRIAFRITATLLELETLKQFAPKIATVPTNAVVGLIQTFIYAYIFAYIFAWLYNYLTRN